MKHSCVRPQPLRRGEIPPGYGMLAARQRGCCPPARGGPLWSSLAGVIIVAASGCAAAGEDAESSPGGGASGKTALSATPPASSGADVSAAAAGGSRGGGVGPSASDVGAPRGPGAMISPSGAPSGGDPAGSGSSGAGPVGVGACTITSKLTLSAEIGTVGIVEFSTDLAGMDGGYIEFGLDGAFDMKAPIDAAQPNYRTLLLGMKPDREYQYRIVASAGEERCSGAPETVLTGSAPSTLPEVTLTTPQPDKVAPGYMLMGGPEQGPVFILDSDGDYVWWADVGGLMRAHMSYDGKYIWTQAVNWSTGTGPVAQGANPGGEPSFHRISLDGTQIDAYGMAEFGDATHDFDITDDGSYLFADLNGWSNTGCTMKIVERKADGQLSDVFQVSDAYPSIGCLINAMHHWPDDDSITISDLPNNAIIKLTRSGEVSWVLNGAFSTFTQGDAPRWVGGQHGHQLFADDRILVFLNGTNPGTGVSDPYPNSMVFELQLDPATNTATKLWEYDGGLRAIVFGDVQRLPNGNTLVDYGTAKELHEVDADAQLVQSVSFPSGPPPPYVEWRSSLYGGPPG